MSLLRIGEVKIKPAILSELSIPYYVISETLDTELYYDITSNENWLGLGRNYYDYNFCRNQMMMWTATNGFDNLGVSEKFLAVKNFVVGKPQRDSIMSDEEQQECWRELVDFSQKCRQHRWGVAKSYISYFLTAYESYDIANTTNVLSNNYILYNIQSLELDGTDGLFDWIENTGSFSGGTGFNSKSYWTNERGTKLINILKYGIY